VNRSAQTQYRCGVAGGWIIISKTSTEGTPVTNSTITDMAGKLCQRWNQTLYGRRSGNLSVGTHGPNTQAASFFTNAFEIGNAAQVDQIARVRQTQTNGW
jgi:hypothetical protein